MKKVRLNANRELIHQTVCAIFIKNDEIMLIRKSDKAYGDKLSVVAGHIEEDEDHQSALVREVKEEIGLDVKDFVLMKELKDLNDTCRYGANIHDWYVYKINDDIDIQKLILDKSEISELFYVKISEMKKLEDKFTSGSKSMFKALGWL